MKATIDGKRYDANRCEELGSYDYHNNGNYSGTTYLLRAADGVILEHTDSNGQDCYLSDSLELHMGEIDRFDFDREQEKRCAELGLITIV